MKIMQEFIRMLLSLSRVLKIPFIILRAEGIGLKIYNRLLILKALRSRQAGGEGESYMLKLKVIISVVLVMSSLVSQATQLSVITYNIWFDSSTAEERVPKLLDIVAEKNADIIAFQEVEGWFIKALESDGRFDDYHFSVERGWFDSVKGGLLLLTKAQAIQQQYIDFPSNMNRGALSIVNRIERAKVCVATVHLESMLDDTQIRIKQLNLITQQTAQCNQSILLGDFNFGDGELENQHIGLGYFDIWKQIRADYAGYTWNTNESFLAKRNSFPSEGSRRLDKIYIKGDMLTPINIEIIGNDSFVTQTGRTLFPSDHFGLSAIFKINKK